MKIHVLGLLTNPIGTKTIRENTPTLKLNSQPTSDIFVKSGPNFCGSTSNGGFLRSLKGIRDPYSGVIILTSREMATISTDLNKKDNIRQKVRYLGNYKDSMLPVEKEVFNKFAYISRKNKFTNFSKILKEEKPYAMRNLIKEQNEVFDAIEEASDYVSPKHKEKIMGELSEARRRVYLPNDEKHRFKRKKFINQLISIHQNEILDKVETKILEKPNDYKALAKYIDTREAINNNMYDVNINGKTPVDMVRELQEKYIPETLNEKDEMEPIIDIANKLPTSKTSVNAFIVKYWDRTEKEIGERLLNQSVGTVEHIHADSLGGENEAANFMFATKLRNEERGNMPIKEYIKLHPNIPMYCQQYTDDIIKAAHKGRIQNHEWYPYLLKDTLKEEAGIDVDISNYKIPPERAFRTLPPRLRTKYPKYKQYIPDPTEPIYYKA